MGLRESEGGGGIFWVVFLGLVPFLSPRFLIATCPFGTYFSEDAWPKVRGDKLKGPTPDFTGRCVSSPATSISSLGGSQTTSGVRGSESNPRACKRWQARGCARGDLYASVSSCARCSYPSPRDHPSCRRLLGDVSEYELDLQQVQCKVAWQRRVPLVLSLGFPGTSSRGTALKDNEQRGTEAQRGTSGFPTKRTSETNKFESSRS